MLLTERRRERVEQDILADNDRLAKHNRAPFRALRILGLNWMSGPGSGKTTLLIRTIADLGGSVPITVIEGDQESRFDAERCSASGRRVNPAINIIIVSAITGARLSSWYDWVARRRGDRRAPESLAIGAFS